MKGSPRNNGRAHDAEIVRKSLVESIRRCSLDRQQIADAMTSSLIPVKGVSLRMVNGYAAESCDDYRFPLDLAISFCEATRDYRLLREMVKRAGFRMIGPEEEKLLELGKAVVAKSKAEAAIAKAVAL